MFTDGLVEYTDYNSGQWLPDGSPKGAVKRSRLERRAVRVLLKDIENAGFFGLEDCYGACGLDCDFITIAVRSGKRSKRVFDYWHRAPSRLKDIERRILEATGVASSTG